MTDMNKFIMRLMLLKHPGCECDGCTMAREHLEGREDFDPGESVHKTPNKLLSNKPLKLANETEELTVFSQEVQDLQDEATLKRYRAGIRARSEAEEQSGEPNDPHPSEGHSPFP